MYIDIMVFICIDETKDILMISTNEELVKEFKERNDINNQWKILSYDL